MHDVHMSSDYHDVVTRVYAEEVITAFHDQIQEAERLAEELRVLLASYESAMDYDDMESHKETLARWAQRYSSGVSTADKISRNGRAWLKQLNQRIDASGNDAALFSGRNELSNLAPLLDSDAKTPPHVEHFTDVARRLSNSAPPSSSEHAWSRFPVRKKANGQ